jgi:glycosyltransferase involved in cell wall biosynthesis
MAIVLSSFNRPDAERLGPRSVAVVPNGIPDPCPAYGETLGPERGRRMERLRREGGVARALFLANCTADKGVFDALEAIAMANTRAREGGAGAGVGPRIEWELVVAGGFVLPEEEEAFRGRVARPDLARCVRHVGFVSGASKERVFREADVFLFPSYFANEGQPLGLIEAMAHGLMPVTTRWRGIPEMLPEGYAGLVAVRDAAGAAAALDVVIRTGEHLAMRAGYERQFSLAAHRVALAAALRGVGA